MHRLAFSISMACLSIVLLTSAAEVHANESIWSVRYEVDVPVTAGLLAGSYGLSFLSVERTHRWDSELLGIDEPFRGGYSSQAASISDVTLWLSLLSPVAAIGAGGFESSTGHRSMIYVETLSAALLLTQTAKYVVQRPRPFVYSQDPLHRGRSASEDSRLSFFSGHSSLAFAGAISGSYLFAAQSKNEAGRAAFWGLELALATTTAGLRVRAGKHFPSDVLLGSAVGAGLGIAIPRLHLDPPSRYSPALSEWLAMAGGLATGIASSTLLPVTLDTSRAWDKANVQMTPLILPGGGGFMLFGML